MNGLSTNAKKASRPFMLMLASAAMVFGATAGPLPAVAQDVLDGWPPVDTVQAQRTPEVYKPLKVEIKRNDKIEKPTVGDKLTFDIRVTNENKIRVISYPRSANISGVTVDYTNNCRHTQVRANNDAYTCLSGYHYVTPEDEEAGSFTAKVAFDVVDTIDGKTTYAKGQEVSAQAIHITKSKPEGTEPFEVEWTRTDSNGKDGKDIKVGDTLTWNIKVTNKTGKKTTAFPRRSNLSGVLTDVTQNCRYSGLDPNASYTCTTASHRVGQDDFDRGGFTPVLQLDAIDENANSKIERPGSILKGTKVVFGNVKKPEAPKPPTTPESTPEAPKPPAPSDSPSSAPAPTPTQAPPAQPPAPAPAPQPAPPSPQQPSPQQPTPQPSPSDETRPSAIEVQRLSGASRVETSTSISQEDFKTGAETVVIARADNFADSVSAVPLAQELKAPVLLTQSDVLHPSVRAEIRRLQPRGGKVIIMGGEAAISKAVEAEIAALGGQVERVAGVNRADTAVKTAAKLAAMGKQTRVLVADGTDWQPALLAGPAAAKVDGVTLLTNGASMAPETAAYLRSVNSLPVQTVGANAGRALPSATNVNGNSPTDLSLAVAKAFFNDPKAIGAATDAAFADALSGGAHVARHDGPLVLLPKETPLAVHTYIRGEQAISNVYIYGGQERISHTQAQALTR